MLRSIGVQFLDVPELSSIESALRHCNEHHKDRQVRVKLEAYSSTQKEKKVVDGESKIKIESDSESTCAPDVNENGKRTHDVNEIEAETKEYPAVDDEPFEKKRRGESVDTVSGVVVVPFSTRRWKSNNPKKNLFKNLVLTLNQSFPDYDFGSVRIEQFQRVSFAKAIHVVNTQFFELACGTSAVKVCSKDLWIEIENIVGHPVIDAVNNDVVDRTMEGVQIYTYSPEDDVEIDGDPLSSLGNLWSFNFFFCNPSIGKVVFLACSCRQRKFSQSSDTVPGLVSHNSFFEAWEEDVSEEDDSDDEVETSVALDVDGSNLAVAF